jgi:hypothetical protein
LNEEIIMGRPYVLLSATFLVGSFFCHLARAQDQPAIIVRGKKATVLLSVGGRALGSAFCVDSFGLFATNAHLVQRFDPDISFTLAVEPGEKTQRELHCNVLRVSADQDLAILFTSSAASDLTTLQLGFSENLYETAPVTAFGYPFGRMLSEQGSGQPPPFRRPAFGRDLGEPIIGDLPSVTVSTGHVTSLRTLNGSLQHIQLDASLNPGNSGGPVLDQSGKVVGIVQAGIYGSGINLAIPVEKLTKLLEIPQILFRSRVSYAMRHEITDMAVRLMPAGDHAQLTVRFIYRGANGAEQTFEPTLSSDGSYHVKVIPFPRHAEPVQLRVMVEGADGALTGFTPDFRFSCGGRSLKLSEVLRVRFGRNPAVLLATGEKLSGAIVGFEATKIDIGGLTIQADLTRVPAVRVTRIEAEEAPAAYRILVLRDREVVQDAAGAFMVDPFGPTPLPTLRRR